MSELTVLNLGLHINDISKHANGYRLLHQPHANTQKGNIEGPPTMLHNIVLTGTGSYTSPMLTLKSTY